MLISHDGSHRNLSGKREEEIDPVCQNQIQPERTDPYRTLQSTLTRETKFSGLIGNIGNISPSSAKHE